MKIVILAGGNGTRMKTLTEDLPKPLLTYKGLTLLEHKLKIVPSTVNEIIIVIGYLGQKIKSEFGDSFNDISIRYVEQKELLGTAHALYECREYLNEDFIVLMGDDIYSKEDILKLSQGKGWGILVYKKPESNGVQTPEKNKVLKILTVNTPEFIYTGACHLTPEIFSTEMEKISGENSEYGLPHTIAKFIDKRKIEVITTTNWNRITSPDDLI